MAPTAHLLHGFAGAGRTTLARRLEAERPIVRFTHDEWMHRLYGANPEFGSFEDLFSRVDAMIWVYAERLLELGTDVVLDHGFWSRDSRDAARKRVSSLGATPLLYRVDCAEALMRERVTRRSQDVPADSLWIDEAAFDSFKRRFEPLGVDEERIEIGDEGR
ncbi:MAG: ATP-binding protein [Planctomycetota bacterium]